MFQRWAGVAGLLMTLLAVNMAESAIVSDVRNTKHNLSALPYNAGGGVVDDRTVKANTENQLCVFCHTPHAAENAPNAPLWNRKLNAVTYTAYSSGSIDASDLGQPIAGTSKLCLTCHDGTQAIGAVNVLNGSLTDQNPATGEISMTGTMPVGSGLTTGNTRNLGIDLSNDHPISFTYNTAMALADGDVIDPATVSYIKNASPGARPDLPLYNDKMECATCHDPHVRDSTGTDIKFLRLNRFQVNTNPTGIAFNKTNDTICLGCHYKQGWANSAHANPLVSDEIYTNVAADLRGFPRGIKVWEASCMNCHEAHTVQGAKRLLRDGTDSITVPKGAGNQAEEEVCITCHSNDGGTLTIQGWGTQVPDIKSDIMSPNYRMPLHSEENPLRGLQATETHSIGGANPGVLEKRGANNVETQENLGLNNPANRHAECTDCHHNHRMIRNRTVVSNPATPDAGGTHNHDQSLGRHTNFASGVLRGSWGVEPIYGNDAFRSLPTSYQVKYGVPPVGDTLVDTGLDATTKTYVSREYQVCLKCHSSYAFGTTPPNLGQTCTGCTPSAFNGSARGKASGMTKYTDQAMEFQAPPAHQGEIGKNLGYEGGANSGYDTENHRSWHPVMRPTGRTKAERKLTSMAAFLAPWSDDTASTDVGFQTMFCSDCHGRKSQPMSGWPIDPVVTGKNENGRAWGAHGSEFKFILKGIWDDESGDTGSTDDLCFKCHYYNIYAGGGGSGKTSGFNGSGFSNLHKYHLDKAPGGRLRCSWCHVAVPHGWKNKSLLVNLNDVNPAETERHPTSDAYVSFGVTRKVAHPFTGPLGDVTYEIDLSEWKNAPANPYKGQYVGYYNPPYYNAAAMKFKRFAASGTWQASDCDSRSGLDGSGDAVDWMKTVCRSLP